MLRDIIASLKQQVQPTKGHRYGVVIGIEKYQDSRLNLKCARADAQVVYEVMTDPTCGMFSEENVTLLLDEDATKKSIWNALAGLRRKVGLNDTVWIYYAGHGATEDSDYYWVPFDGNVDSLYATGVSRDNISDAIGKLAAEKVVTFLDCCYAAATAAKTNATRVTLSAKNSLMRTKVREGSFFPHPMAERNRSNLRSTGMARLRGS